MAAAGTGAPAGGAAEPDTLDLPVIDLEAYLRRGEGPEWAARFAAEAAKAAAGLRDCGVLILRDPRASAADNDVFLDMLERYFEQPEDVKAADVRKEFYYQVGTTPERTELPRDHCARMRAYAEADRPVSLCPPEKDAKARFFWRMGERPPATKFEQLNAPPVVPGAFPEWAGVMDTWGGKLLDAAVAVAELAAVGFGLPEDTFSSRMRYGPHLLAPTASNFNKFGDVGTVLAGYHYDLNFITAHGRSRYPGLYVWTRDGSKRAVKIPPGCLLAQAGKQAEYLTGGTVLAGFHEVVVTPGTAAAIAAARDAGRSLWRISSTLFSHIASDVVLEPVGALGADAAVRAQYPPILTGDHVKAELAAINLGEGSDGAAAPAY
jgi:isopenicillin N synthase-like dioxygenase